MEELQTENEVLKQKNKEVLINYIFENYLTTIIKYLDHKDQLNIQLGKLITNEVSK